MTNNRKIIIARGIKRDLIGNENGYICIFYALRTKFDKRSFHTEKGSFEVQRHMMLEFPELHDMIISVGLELDDKYEWGNAWYDENETCENDTGEEENDFRIEKMRELIIELKTEFKNG